MGRCAGGGSRTSPSRSRFRRRLDAALGRGAPDLPLGGAQAPAPGAPRTVAARLLPGHRRGPRARHPSECLRRAGGPRLPLPGRAGGRIGDRARVPGDAGAGRGRVVRAALRERVPRPSAVRRGRDGRRAGARQLLHVELHDVLARGPRRRAVVRHPGPAAPRGHHPHSPRGRHGAVLRHQRRALSGEPHEPGARRRGRGGLHEGHHGPGLHDRRRRDHQPRGRPASPPRQARPTRALWLPGRREPGDRPAQRTGRVRRLVGADRLPQQRRQPGDGHRR